MSKMIYQPTWESLNQHKIPKWFMDSKLGIFIHWGVYSVPGWAPLYTNKKDYYNERIGYHPYAELYGYGMLYKKTPVWKYHVEKYGASFQYDDFIPKFKAENWNPGEWAKLFKETGAKYVVLVTKHSDGYCMWPTKQTSRNCFETGPHRDITGDLSREIKAQDLKMGLYYSLTFNWYFENFPHINYRKLSHNQLKELINNYEPDILWSDDYWKPDEKSYSTTWQSKDMIAYYYNQAKNSDQVLVNDRWGREENGLQIGDFSTPEYKVLPKKTDFYWELTRGIGQSYGYNQNETEKDYLTVSELIKMLVDVVSKNGNMLLNVGPKADGTLCTHQEQRLKGLGEWLGVNGEAIYGTRTWVDAEGDATNGFDVRYTMKDEAVYAILTGGPKSEVTIRDIRVKENTRITLLGSGKSLDWKQKDDGLYIKFPEKLPCSHAYTLKITPQPWKLMTKNEDSFLESKFGEIWRKTGFTKINI